MRVSAVALWLVLVGAALGASSSSDSSRGRSSSSGSVSSSGPTASANSKARSSTQLSTASIDKANTTSTVLPTQTAAAPQVTATASAVPLRDSVPVRTELDARSDVGAFFTFNATEKDTIYISMSLCRGPEIPAYNTSNSTLLDELDLNAEQAQRVTLVGLFVSDKPSIPNPGPKSKLSSKQVQYAQGGWAKLKVENAKQGLWIGVWPPVDARNATGTFNAQISASTKAQMEEVNASTGVLLDDTDSTRALLTSFNYTAPPNISLMVLPTEGEYSLSSITYYNSSLCAIFDLWSNLSLSRYALHINSSETTRHTASVLTRESEMLKYLHDDKAPEITSASATGTAGIQDPLNQRSYATPLPHKRDNTSTDNDGGSKNHQKRMQFDVSGLRHGTNYTAYLVRSSNENGVLMRELYPSVKFATKTSRSCRLLYNVPFCPEVAYSVPFNEEVSLAHALSEVNSIISANFANFSATLSTFPCDSQEFGMYSSVATCADCVRAYQNWLCAVVLPRCTDVIDPEKSAASQDGSELQGLPMETNKKLYPYVVNRVGGNSSRLPYIDQLLKPRPYGEVLPCLTVCEMVTRSCPPLIKWSCPIWTVTAQRDYGTFADADAQGLGYGKNGGAGSDGMRFGGWPSMYVATDAFGHTYCNAMDTDRMLRLEAGGSKSLRPNVIIHYAAVLATALAALYIY